MLDLCSFDPIYKGSFLLIQTMADLFVYSQSATNVAA